MAIIIEKNKNFSNESKYKRKRNIGVVSGIITIISWLAFVMNMSSSNNNTILLLIIFVVAASLSNYFLRGYKKLQAGNAGEKNAFQYFKKLSDEYYLMHNVNLKKDGRKAELDILILSPYGIYIIEVKNHNGSIEGNKNESLWVQNKVGKGGTPYKNSMKNPLKQLGFQKYFLSDILKEKGIKVWIDGYVLMPSVSNLSVNSNEVYTNAKNICNKLIRQKEVKVKKETIQRIIKILMDTDI